ncbi:MAG: NAD-glutamate dehydrogenase [Xanthomonadales bacterium]|nr:NAD-glutamate dehydrogenase [Xanthomonadales bacterium]
MTHDTEKQKASLTQQIITSLKKQLKGDDAKRAVCYVEQCFRRVPVEDLASYAPQTLAAMVVGQLEFLKLRQPGEILIRVFNPRLDVDGWESPHTIIEMVNDDTPFLVDSASLTLNEIDLSIHLIIHPVIRLGRDAKGQLEKVFKKKEGAGVPESVMHFQVDRRTGTEDLENIRLRLESSFTDVHRAVEDWRKMESSAVEAAENLRNWGSNVEEKWLLEYRAFLDWLQDDHFVFLGARDYEVVRSRGGGELRIVPGSGLGILRETEETTHSRPLASLADAARKHQQQPLIITKTNARSTVHRLGYLDYIGVLKFDKKGRTIGERRFLGLFTSAAYTLNAMDTPLVRARARNVLANSGLIKGSHAWKSMIHTLETLPRDELYQASSSQLQQTAMGVLNLQERQRVRLFIRQERYSRFYSCLVYLPRERFNTENREAIQEILNRALRGSRLDYAVHISESKLARLQVIVRPRRGAEVLFDVEALENKIVEAVRSWTDELRSILVQKRGEEEGLKMASRFGRAFPEAYKEDISPWVAAFDVENANAVYEGADLRMSLYRPKKPRSGIIRFKIFRNDSPIPLSDVLPMLENLGLHIVNERPYELKMPDEERLWIQDFDMVPAVDRELDLDVIRNLFQEAFEKTLRGETDSDGFNRLVIASQMHWRQVKILRAYCKYLLQTGVPFSMNYMAETLSRHPGIARLLVELFEASFDPAREQETDYRKELASKRLERRMTVLMSKEIAGDGVLAEFLSDMAAARGQQRDAQVNSITRAFRRALESVTSLDEDRMLFAFFEVIRATLRTSYFQVDGDGAAREYISFKIDSTALPELPRPKPFREIWVYSPRVEGIHLRGGKIARGGLRWSDRREDFRTEVLGLMKAQSVKNTMIVPVGAKGGFVVKRMPASGERDAVMQEVVSCYKLFINGLLDITDNLDKDKIIPPTDVIRRDDDDPYLVVAADKGTATFSDTANSVADQHGFWMGDAFASGGSVGYDHKGMGITARGAWECVKRHFRELGKDIQREPFTVVGIGDMSGDVFGNGMLLSRHTRLQAAFNHQHIFLDPDPDVKKSYQERRRLFRLPRSSWTDYQAGLISSGGGIFSRQEKTIPLSPEVREWLGVEADQMTPNVLIRELLKAPVDLLWNGGIGTYIKSSSEAHADVGDLSNNALRVNGSDLRCKVVGEGGNLGLTQRGRVEFARCGGMVNTDFIDNSAGVDTSDHEVNIKLLLNLAIRAGKLDLDGRNRLLAEMTNDVAALVLRNNYLQTQAITMMDHFSGPRLGAKQHFIRVLEEQGWLDRQLESLPEDEELEERKDKGKGLFRPELAVLLSYSKIMLYQQLLGSDVPEDSYLSGELSRYFPDQLQDRMGSFMQQHRLKREIVATQVTNSLVNRMGASYTLRMCEDTGASPAEVARAYTIAREVFGARNFWSKIEKLDNKVSSELQIAALISMWKLLRQATRWLLNLQGRKLDIRLMVDRLAPGLSILEKFIGDAMSAEEKEGLQTLAQPYVEGGFNRKLAAQTVMLERLFPALDVVETAARRKTDVKRVARVFFGLGDTLELKWLKNHVESLKVSGQWHAVSRANLRDELFSIHNNLVERVLHADGRKKEPVKAWMESNGAEVEPVLDMLKDMRKGVKMDYPTVSVAVRALEQLVAKTAP